MVVRKGPQGQFLIKKLSDEDELYSYALEVIEREKPVNLLPVYVYPGRSDTELGFDITGLTSVADAGGEYASRHRSVFRDSTADLLLFVSRMEDLFLPVRQLSLTPENVFFDNEGHDLHLLFDPSNVLSPGASDIASQAEALLSGEFFGNILTAGEITDIVYAAREGDPASLERAAAALKDKNAGPSTKLAINKYIYLSAIMSFGAAVALFSDFLPLAIVMAVAAGYFLLKLRGSGGATAVSADGAADRSRIFFEEKKKESACLILTSKTAGSDGQPLRKSVCLSEAIVGSDLFLSDICFDLPSVNPIHVKIFINDNTYYVKDISMSGLTFIDDIKLQKDEEREIKDGQVLRMGEQDFTVSVGFS